MTWTEQWQRMDPMRVLERKQERAARSPKAKAEKARQGLADLFKEQVLTQDQSEQIESLLATWYGHERAYLPNLGAPRISPSCRGYQSNDTQDDGDDRDAKLERITAEAVASCVDQLALVHRCAIGVHCRNKAVGVSVHRNPRIEDQHRVYQEAKMQLLPIFKRKGLV